MDQEDGPKMLDVQRDEKGRLKKGSKINPYGSMDRKKVIALRQLNGLTGKAIATLGRLLESDNHSAALGAAKEVLDRNLGKVKQSVSVDVTQTHVLHLQALEELAQRKRSQLETPGKLGNLTLDHERLGHVIEGELVAIEQEEAAETPPVPASRGAAAFAPSTPATDQNSLTPSPLPFDKTDADDESKK